MWTIKMARTIQLPPEKQAEQYWFHRRFHKCPENIDPEWDVECANILGQLILEEKVEYDPETRTFGAIGTISLHKWLYLRVVGLPSRILLRLDRKYK
jgi:hypothetical protein